MQSRLIDINNYCKIVNSRPIIISGSKILKCKGSFINHFTRISKDGYFSHS